MALSYDRTRLQAQVCDLLARGYRLWQVEAIDGMPSRQTINRWRRADAGFAFNMAQARTYGRALVSELSPDRHAFDAGRAEAFLVKVRLGYPVRTLVRTDGQPGRDTLNAWKARAPGFADALVEAVAFARANRPLPWPFDQVVADQIVMRVNRGETLPALWKDPSLPGRDALRRWRKRVPAFDAVMRMAVLGGHRRRMRARVGCTPQLTERVMEAILMGGSLRSAGRAPGMPHPVTLYGWVRTRRDFAEAVQQACVDREDWFADAELTAAEEATPETMAQARRRIGEIRRRRGQTRRYPGAARRALEAVPPSMRRHPTSVIPRSAGG